MSPPLIGTYSYFDFPRYKYPLEENARENEAEDKRCLAKVEAILEDQIKKSNPVVGMIIEPIQSEGGDHHGSNAWFQVCSLELLSKSRIKNSI